MIVNWSRLSGFAECPEKQWQWDHERHQGWTTALPLLQGSGFHEGIAHFFATRNIEAAREWAEQKMRAELVGKVVFPEELPEINHAIAWTKMAVARFAENYEHEPVLVLWPEVQFCVPIPDSHHTCWEMHKRFCKTSWAECVRANTDPINSARTLCWQPHWFRGKTDAVVQFLGGLWLMEHKTNSVQLEMFVQKYFLDAQVTGYMYGIEKQMGVELEGFILNIIQKPHPKAKDQMTVGFARETFQRSREDLTDFEGEFRSQAQRYEEAFMGRERGNPFAIVRNTRSCTNWGRKCQFWNQCQRHPREPLEGEFAQREPDYVDLAYQEIYNKWKEQHV